MRVKKEIVDFHAHILPGADHGSVSVETSLFQIYSAIEMGVSRIIATPHFYPHRHTVNAFIKRRDEAFLLLKDHLPFGVEIKLGAEVLICPGIENLPGLEKLFINGTNALLLELPFDNFDEAYCESVREMTSRGIDVIIAHADRYRAFNIEKLLRSGATLQLNASSLLGLVKRKDVYSWLDRGAVVALGSDIHGEDKKAYAKFAKAIYAMGDRVDYIKEQSDFIWKNSK